MSTKLETETYAGKSIQAWRDQATKAGLVLREPSDKTDSGDYPDKIYSTLRRFRRNIAITKDHKKIITNISRQLVIALQDQTTSHGPDFSSTGAYHVQSNFKNGSSYPIDVQIVSVNNKPVENPIRVLFELKTS